MGKRFWAPLLVFLSFYGYGQTKELVRVTDLLKIRSIGEIVLSKDGTKAVAVVTTIEPDPAAKGDYKYVPALYLVPADGSAAPRALTSREAATQPAWSPDGKRLAFVRAVEGRSQIFLLSLDGGEAIQFTHYKYGASRPRWSPDGKSILFASNIRLEDLIKDSSLNPDHRVPSWPDEQAGVTGNGSLRPSHARADADGSPEEIRAYLDNDAADKKAKVLSKLNFQDEMGVSAEMSFNRYLTQGMGEGSKPVAITNDIYRYTDVDFMPDGKHLLITADIDSLEHPDRSLESEIYMADADGSHLRLLLGEKGHVFSNATISPSGKYLAYQTSTTSFVSVPQLAVLDLASGTRMDIPFDRTKGGYTWSKDEKYIYFTAQSNGGAPLYRANVGAGAAGAGPTAGKVEQLTDYNSGTGSFDLQGTRLVFVRTEAADPFELYTADASVKEPKRISAFNYDWIQGRKLSLPEKHTFTNSQGMAVEYWVMKPTDYVAGRKYPLLLDIHGGPSAMWGPGENSMWHEFQYFCSRGYGVVYCNPRGSGGYGLNFLRANVEDWGTGPTSDVFAALDKAVAEGWADTSKLVVSGGSYAGYLVAWIVGHDHRFKAACAQRGVYDLATFFGEGNAWRLVPNYFGGYPWEPKVKAILQRESPITYVDQITTPLIIFHGENDRRTGFVQGEMLYRSLKVLGRPVEYVRHPGATHELTRSGDNRQRIDQMLRTYEFFERWIHAR